MLYKQLDKGAFNWSGTGGETLEIPSEQYRMLMQGLEVIARRPIQEVPDLPRTL